MNDAEFSALAEKVLQYIADRIETEDTDGNIEVDFYGDMLNLAISRNTFVINKHSAAKEIWLASPFSGPYHFSYAAGKWKSRSGDDLFEILETELNIKLRNFYANQS